MRGPATAAMRRIRRPASEREAIRPARISRSEVGSASSAPVRARRSSPASSVGNPDPIVSPASSSSAKNGLPPDRSVDPLGEIAGHATAEDPGELLALLLEAERRQLEALHVAVPAELGEADEERIATLQVVGPESPDEQDPSAPQVAHEEHEQVPRRRVAPMEVLEGDHERAFRAQPFDEGEGQLKEPCLVRRARRGRRRSRGNRSCPVLARLEELGEARRDAHELDGDVPEQLAQVGWREFLAEVPQDLEEGTVRQALATEVETGAHEHAGPRLPGAFAELRDEPRLAEPGVATDED